MQITRSTKCSLKFATKHKRAELRRLLREYGRVVNFFISEFWPTCPSKSKLLKPIVDLPDTWLDFTLRQTAAREAIDMIKARLQRDGKRAKKPTHRGQTMRVSTGTARLNQAHSLGQFEQWLSVKNVPRGGQSTRLSMPILRHKHMDKLEKLGGRLCGSYVISADCVQLAYAIERPEPSSTKRAIGLDTGIKALATLSSGRQYGREIQPLIERVKRCKQGSRGQQRARRALKQTICEVAKMVAALPIDLVVVEDLKGLSHGTKLKARLSKSMRASIGAWNWRLWLDRLRMACEVNRVQVVAVPPAYTSQICHRCGHLDRRNRNGEVFKCLSCGHKDNADINASKNILARYLGGAQGPACKGVKLNGIPVST